MTTAGARWLAEQAQQLADESPPAEVAIIELPRMTVPMPIIERLSPSSLAILADTVGLSVEALLVREGCCV